VLAVADANVAVSSVISTAGAPAAIIRRWRSEAFDLAVSEPILAEYERVLRYPRIRRRHRLRDAEIAALIDGFRRFATLVEVTDRRRVVLDDPDDDKYLDCARAAGASYVVSGDRHLLAVREHEGIRILSPRAFLTLIDQLASHPDAVL
jgi:putative PIN family toxin of toxin-antitoxin system